MFIDFRKINGGGGGGGEYVLPKASATKLGGVKVGENLSIDANGVLSATGGGAGGGDYKIVDTLPETGKDGEMVYVKTQYEDKAVTVINITGAKNWDERNEGNIGRFKRVSDDGEVLSIYATMHSDEDGMAFHWEWQKDGTWHERDIDGHVMMYRATSYSKISGKFEYYFIDGGENYYFDDSEGHQWTEMTITEETIAIVAKDGAEYRYYDEIGWVPTVLNFIIENTDEDNLKIQNLVHELAKRGLEKTVKIYTTLYGGSDCYMVVANVDGYLYCIGKHSDMAHVGYMIIQWREGRYHAAWGRDLQETMDKYLYVDEKSIESAAYKMVDFKWLREDGFDNIWAYNTYLEDTKIEVLFPNDHSRNRISINIAGVGSINIYEWDVNPTVRTQEIYGKKYNFYFERTEQGYKVGFPMATTNGEIRQEAQEWIDNGYLSIEELGEVYMKGKYAEIKGFLNGEGFDVALPYTKSFYIYEGMSDEEKTAVYNEILSHQANGQYKGEAVFYFFNHDGLRETASTVRLMGGWDGGDFMSFANYGYQDGTMYKNEATLSYKYDTGEIIYGYSQDNIETGGNYGTYSVGRMEINTDGDIVGGEIYGLIRALGDSRDTKYYVLSPTPIQLQGDMPWGDSGIVSLGNITYTERDFTPVSEGEEWNDKFIVNGEIKVGGVLYEGQWKIFTDQSTEKVYFRPKA